MHTDWANGLSGQGQTEREKRDEVGAEPDDACNPPAIGDLDPDR